MSDSPLAQAPLGRAVAYPHSYDPSQLFPIARAQNRSALRMPGPWFGADIWNAYEVSWLNGRGLPRVALARFTFPADSANLVESKSFKLYLNSFNESRFSSQEEVAATLQADLSRAAGAPVSVELMNVGAADALGWQPLEGICLDEQDIAIEHYQPEAGLLRIAPGAEVVSETLVSHLLKSNCPVTGQPDWGSVQVRYTGPRIDPESLLKYIVSFRRHTEFHEHCVERMYCDIWHALQPTSLFVMALYTRRGGLDINPWRSSQPEAPPVLRTVRQ
ncbi:MAG TPA: NADPH-dependent 7-cyano-7-deazaguanine reductase QueF [Burkholderiaceae bacterium]|nr:NADPH-dependent 7-cyano-7-deazaguanine reductase QueF [Burkholderiaceae bacterium]